MIATQRIFATLLFTILFLVSSSQAQLPELSSANSSDSQLAQEYEIGRTWVRIVKSRARLLDDPVVTSYLNQLTWRLVPHSELQDRRVELLTLDEREINAFAAPGGIIGVHAGLLASSRREDELASVIAHELAHLSQRHYAQQQAQAEQQAPLVLAGIIGGILLAGINPDAGSAAISGTLGASANQRLAFSRANELDADQSGMRTLIAAGFDPQAMPRMFQLLLNENRFASDIVPEFLRTHPITQNRIADSTNRAISMSRTPTQRESSIEYVIAKVRAQLHFSMKPSFEQSPLEQSYYAFAKAALSGDVAAAQTLWDKLPETLQWHAWAQLPMVDAYLKRNRTQDASDLIGELYALYPDDQTIMRAAADFWGRQGNPQEAVQLYRDLIREQPGNPSLWYHLAEVYGLLGDREQLNRARIEFFLLRGEVDLALRQIEFARRDARRDELQLGWLDQKEREVLRVRNQIDQLF